MLTHVRPDPFTFREFRPESIVVPLHSLPTAAKANQFSPPLPQEATSALVDHRFVDERELQIAAIMRQIEKISSFMKEEAEGLLTELDCSLPLDNEGLSQSSIADVQEKVVLFSILYLFSFILKSMVKSKTQNGETRHEEHLARLELVISVAKSYKGTAKFSFMAELLGGVVSMAGGFAPIIGFTSGGDVLVKGAANIFGSEKLKELDSITAFKKLGEILSAFGPMQRSTSEIRKHNGEGERFRNQQFADILRSFIDELVRGSHDLDQNFNSVVQMILDLLRDSHDRALATHGVG